MAHNNGRKNLTVVLTRVGPDCGSVQALYRLTSCVLHVGKNHMQRHAVSLCINNKQKSSCAIQ